MSKDEKVTASVMIETIVRREMSLIGFEEAGNILFTLLCDDLENNGSYLEIKEEYDKIVKTDKRMH